jgi:two-component system KDP operon response regulator KdpE
MTPSLGTILVVDDEPQIHRFLGPALTAANFSPLRADRGDEALRLAAARSACRTWTARRCW